MNPDTDMEKSETIKPSVLYHASENRDIQEFEPRNIGVRDPNEGPVVFATPDKALASTFLVPTHGDWVKIGKYNNIPCMIISDKERFMKMDKGGTIYHLPSDTFETNPYKGMGEQEWTSKVLVAPTTKEVYESGLEAMLELGVQVYFVDQPTLEAIRSSTDHGFAIVQGLRSENQERDINTQPFTK